MLFPGDRVQTPEIESQGSETLPANVLARFATLDSASVAAVLEGFETSELDDLIDLTDNAAMVNRLARIERGRRHEKLPPIRGDLVTPSLTRSERNARSEERRVAEWFDANDQPIETVADLGWKKLVGEARKAKRREVEHTPANPDATLPDSTDGRISLLHGDFRERLLELEPGSVDLIVTDPPYPKEDLPLWSDLAEVAAKILAPRGLLFAYTGQIFLPEVLNRLGDHLTYGWTFALQLPGSGSRIMGRHIIQAWKPVLAFSTGTWPSGEWGDDWLVSPERQKVDYAWQQNAAPARRIIERYTAPDGLVVDPFLGVGSFGVAAKEAGRRFVGVELDGARFQKAKDTIYATT